ncbi:NADH dehydrogenase subunit [Candidatus Thorarchaeota archaeon]|nr:MAG: NADH dehydrogenase subunit [Candidatus Thorarchaeota archaeon]
MTPRKDTVGRKTTSIPVGPQHPALKEPESFTFEIDGETIVDVIPRLGYVHRGIEKAMESRTYIQNLYLAERICGICSHSHTTCYAQGVEELLDVKIPDRANFIRVIIAELERIHSHMLWLGVAAHEIGFDTLFMHSWLDRELVMDLLELISGNRVNYAMNTIGGVRRNISDDGGQKVKDSLADVEERMKHYVEVIKTDQSIRQRTKNIGPLNCTPAADLCAAGPTLRASGIARDVRKDDPYAAYGEIPFDVISYDGCDLFSRTLVRCEEILEAIKITDYAIDNLPEGAIRVRAARKVPEGRVVSRLEAPRGELIHYCKSNGTDTPERYKVRAPTLANVLALGNMLIGGNVADIPIVLAGIDPCFSCMDRMAFVDTKSDKRWTWTQEDLQRYALKC